MNERIQQNMMHRVAIGDCLRRSTRRYPNKVALKHGERSVTYKELNDLANQFGNSLLKRGLAKGTKIAFVAPNCIEFFIAFFGASKAGMILVPINPMFKPKEMSFVINDSECEVFIFDGKVHPLIKDAFEGLEKVKHVFSFDSPSEEFEDLYGFLQQSAADEVEVFIEDRDVVAIYYTGGTTSFPKGAQLTHLSLFVDISSYLMDIHCRPEDKLGVILPLFHVAAFTTTMLMIMTGSTVVIIAQVDPKLIMDTVQNERLTNLLLMPPLFRPLMAHPDFEQYDFSSLRLLGYFGAVMPEGLMHEVMEKICPNLWLCFGQTEMSPVTTVFKPEDHLRKPSSLGISTVHCEIAVMDDNGNFLPAGQIGEFVYRSPTVMHGYYKKDEDNKKAFKYGWFHSGDLGYLDKEGFLYFVDRKKDMVKTGGENVASIEVEKVIYQDPRVQDVHVVGLPHERWSEAVTAFVIPKPDAAVTEEEIISLCRSKMARFKVPKKVIFLNEMPRSSVGKVLKYKIKQEYKNLYKGEG